VTGWLERTLTSNGLCQAERPVKEVSDRGRKNRRLTGSSGMRRGLVSLTLRLLQHVSVRRKRQFALLLALTLAGSAAEVISLGAVVPFISALTAPEKLFKSPAMAGVVRWFDVTSPDQMVLLLTVAFGVAAVAAGVLRLVLLWVSTMLSNGTGADLSVAVYRKTLYQPYSVHVARSSSRIISGMTQKVSAAASVLLSLVTVVTSAFLFLAILLTLFVIDPVVASISALSFGSGYGIIAWLTRHRLRRNSELIAREQTTVVRALQEGLGAIRDVLLDGTQAVYIAVYERAVRPLQRAIGDNSFITLAPRYAMETLGMLLVAVLAYAVSRRSGDVGSALPVLAAIGLGAQRLLPLLQQLYGNWSVVAGSHAVLIDVLDLLEQPMPDDLGAPSPPPLKIRDRVTLDNVRFRYDAAGPWVLSGISLDIERGSRTGIVGTTGSGKSTALDLLMLLLEPTDGRILVDGEPLSPDRRRAWQRSIAHVPQNIFLSDASIAENIAFGVPREMVDMGRVREAARRAQLADFIESRPGGYAAVVGERGIRLSGGQRQRIGIARALYKEATVLIFDEATSALDSATETSVMEAVRSLDRDLTILIIAHRLSTLVHCDTIVRLERGQLTERGRYEQFATTS
jgi:ATP-binding cassette, subfamily B, bacterial PglK